MPSIDLLTSSISGALIVLSGASYAILFAFSKVLDKKILLNLAYCSYATLLLSAYFLVQSLNLSGLWIGLVLIMLVGYWLGPRFIWGLSVKTHIEENNYD
ncbi:MAG: hypothetical protein CMD53_00720 [Gammaproteobacteria bacterium]|nr:hypothetical protein [Gammaproteobacteria bacterium]HJL96205.1 hypothetical protein [SAR86 cluster bacterium]|tara:strand:+ start:292 stop:591 length:300 start_codon:yes stop_codon:yes gene_type:complete